MPRTNPNSPGPGRSTIPTSWKVAGHGGPDRGFAVAADPGYRRRPCSKRSSWPWCRMGSAPGARPCSHHWNGHYFVPGAAFALWIARPVLLIPLVVIALARIDEIAAIAVRPPPARLLHPNRIQDSTRITRPKFRSIFRPTANRRRCSRRRSMPWRGSTTRISNAWSSSTTRPIRRMWQPVEEHCRALGDRFKFVQCAAARGLQGRRAAAGA